MLRDIHVLLVADGGGGLKATVLTDEGVQRLLKLDSEAVSTPRGAAHYFSRFPAIDGSDCPPLMVDGSAELNPSQLSNGSRLLLHVDRIVVPRYVPGHFEI